MTVPAHSGPALHVPFQRYSNILALNALADHGPSRHPHHRFGAAQQYRRATGLENEAVQGLRDKSDMTLPVRFCHVHGQLEVDQVSPAPCVEIWAVQEIGWSASTHAEDNSTKSTAGLGLQDCRTYCRQADASRDDDQIVFGGIQIPSRSERSSDTYDVTDGGFVQRAADGTDSPNSMNTV